MHNPQDWHPHSRAEFRPYHLVHVDKRVIGEHGEKGQAGLFVVPWPNTWFETQMI